MADLLSIDALLANTAEPLRQHRWVLSINGLDAYTMRTAKLPGGTFGETVIDFINTKRYLAGKITYDPIPITLWNPIAPSVGGYLIN